LPKIPPVTIEFQVEIDGNRHSPKATLPYSIHPEITREGKIEINRRSLTSIDLSPLANYTVQLTELLILRNNFPSINLNPLKDCRRLTKLELSADGLTEVNLGPLSTCKNIESLFLTSNKFETIDLTPLSSLTNLREFSLMSNQLKEIDLNPLASCGNLELLNLASNKLSSIDLTPIQECEKLTTLWVNWNDFKSINLRPLENKIFLKELLIDHKSGFGLEEIDLTPLLGCNKLETLWLPDTVEYFIDPIVDLNNLFILPVALANLPVAITNLQDKDSFVKKVKVLKHSKLLEERVERDGWARASSLFIGKPEYINYAVLGLRGLEGCRARIHDVVSLVPEGSDFESGRKFILNHLLERLAIRLKRGESTIDIDIEFLKKNEGIKLIPRILELREREMKKLILGKGVTRTNLNDLWNTYYGHMVLKSLGIYSLSIDEDEFREIVAAFHEIGYEL
jgi:hypothetical protein